MGDERLRELERRWRDTGSVDDEAQYLIERVRIGDLAPGRVELAAFCEHPAARHVCETLNRPVAGLTTGAPEAWLAGLLRWGEAPALRALIAVARRLLPDWTSRYPDPEPARAIAVAEARLRGEDPLVVDREGVHRLALRRARKARKKAARVKEPSLFLRAAMAAEIAALTAHVAQLLREMERGRKDDSWAREALEEDLPGVARTIVRHLGEGELVSVLHGAVAEWALQREGAANSGSWGSR